MGLGNLGPVVVQVSAGRHEPPGRSPFRDAWPADSRKS